MFWLYQKRGKRPVLVPTGAEDNVLMKYEGEGWTRLGQEFPTVEAAHAFLVEQRTARK